jgi:hypothetical protein
MCSHFPDSQVILADSEEPQNATLSPSLPQQQSKYNARQFDRMSKNIGAKVRRTFFINGTWNLIKVLFALLPLPTNTTSCMMITTVMKCPDVNLHTIVFPLKHRHMHTSHALGGITVSKNVRRAIVPKVIAIILGQAILPISIRRTTRQISPKSTTFGEEALSAIWPRPNGW